MFKFALTAYLRFAQACAGAALLRAGASSCRRHAFSMVAQSATMVASAADS